MVVGTPRGLQGRLSAVLAALLALIGSLRKLASSHGRPVRKVSRQPRSIATFGAVHIGALELVYTTGG